MSASFTTIKLYITRSAAKRPPVLKLPIPTTTHRSFSTKPNETNSNGTAQNEKSEENPSPSTGKDAGKAEDAGEEGAMTRRLSEMTEQAVMEGGRSARRDIEHVGFSEDLKRQLEERIVGTSFKNEYAAAHSIVDMPVSSECQNILAGLKLS